MFLNSEMITFADYVTLIEENSASRSYACLMLDCSNVKSKFKELQKDIDKDDLYTEEEGHGMETEPHITVLYGIHEQDSNKVKEELELTPVEYTLTGLSLFENDNYDVLKFTVKSTDLKKLNKQCTKNLEYTNSYPDYIPHMTVAYLKQGTGKKYIKLKNPLIGVTQRSDNFTFSTKESKKTKWKVRQNSL